MPFEKYFFCKQKGAEIKKIIKWNKVCSFVSDFNAG